MSCVDVVKVYRPSPLVYALAPRALGLSADALLSVSSSAWDVAGVKAFGFRVAWCNRLGAPEEAPGGPPIWL
jgi:2-haloacid dehalogenase